MVKKAKDKVKKLCPSDYCIENLLVTKQSFKLTLDLIRKLYKEATSAEKKAFLNITMIVGKESYNLKCEVTRNSQ